MEELHRENKRYYQRNASVYENSSWYFFNKYKDQSVAREISLCISELSSKKIKLLEIGSGTGYLLSKIVKIKNISVDYTCIEHSEEMTKILLDRYNDIIPITVYNDSVDIRYIENNIRERKFDLIIGSSILHHLPDYQELIPSLAKLLTMNGVLYIVREPIHKNECKQGTLFQNIFLPIYELINKVALNPIIRRILWPKKIKQESTNKIAIHMFKEGVSMEPFNKLTNNGFKLLFHRKYNRRASSFFSYLENKWLKSTRKDIFGNTLFSVAIKKIF